MAVTGRAAVRFIATINGFSSNPSDDEVEHMTDQLIALYDQGIVKKSTTMDRASKRYLVTDTFKKKNNDFPMTKDEMVRLFADVIHLASTEVQNRYNDFTTGVDLKTVEKREREPTEQPTEKKGESHKDL